MKHISLFSLFALFIILASSCRMEKRLYRSGYYVEKTGKHKDPQSNPSGNRIGKEAAVTEAIITQKAERTEVAATPEICSLPAGITALPASVEKDRITYVASKPPVNLKTETLLQVQQKVKKKSKRAAHTAGGKSQVVALLLCIFLGWLGIHRFYLGYTGMGILYLFTLGIFGIGWIIDIILLIIPNGLTPKGRTSYDQE